MRMNRKLDFQFVDNTLYRIVYHMPGSDGGNTSTVIAAYKKTNEKFHYEFGHPYDVSMQQCVAGAIGIRTEEFHSIEPVRQLEKQQWQISASGFMESIKNTGAEPVCLEDPHSVTVYSGSPVSFDFRKIRSDHFRTKPLDYKEVHDNIVIGLSSYVNKYHLSSLVLGVSGGIDSTVCAALAHEVASKNPFLDLWLLSLPTHTNADDEVYAANQVGKEFTDDKHFIIQPINTIFELCKKTFGSMETGEYSEISPLSCGNIKARIRNNLLYHMAGVHKGIVLDTDNLSEHYLSFFTVHGDVGDLSPLAGLWKHEVYGLAEWMLENVYPDSEALKKSIALMPTDGNGVAAGGDMGQIAPGHTYDDVDDILMNYIEYKGHHTEEYQIMMDELNGKYGAETVNRVIERHHNSEFKRRFAPLMIDIFDGCILENDSKLVF